MKFFEPHQERRRMATTLVGHWLAAIALDDVTLLARRRRGLLARQFRTMAANAFFEHLGLIGVFSSLRSIAYEASQAWNRWWFRASQHFQQADDDRRPGAFKPAKPFWLRALRSCRIDRVMPQQERKDRAHGAAKLCRICAVLFWVLRQRHGARGESAEC